MLLFLIAASTIACSTTQTRSKVSLDIPEEAVVSDTATGPTWVEYNAIVRHARSLRDELAREQERRRQAERAALIERCNKRHAERSERCMYARIQELESSWLPGRLISGTKCTEPEVKCDE